MEALNFVDVARLVNRIGTVTIPLQQSDGEQGQWALHECTVQIGGIQSPLRIIYLFADATQPGTRKARLLCRPDSKAITQVVYADSLLTRSRTVVDSFHDKVASVLGLTAYFRSFITTQTENYLDKIRSLDFKDYVNPKVTVSGAITRRLPNPVLSFLLDPDLTEQRFSGTLGVLLGEPGQGKTFMSRYLANECAQRQTIPIYVHSEQWSRMQQDELSSLWKTIVHSFRYFESPIGWVDGAEEQFLRVALRTGVFRVIFDGFDEFVLWNKGTVDAIEAIQNLQSLSDATGTRILISSRTSFWESEISEEKGNAPPRHTFKIEPFDANNAEKYFARRLLGSKPKQVAATRLFVELRDKVESKSTHFVGRGFFLFLIADLVERGFTSQALLSDGLTVFRWMTEALCERERRRQNLPISAAEQLEAITNFAEFVVRGEPARGETLSLVLQAASNISPQDADALVAANGKLKDHPLLQRDNRGEWSFVQEQIYFNLLAEILIRYCSNPASHASLANLINAKHFSLQVQADVASATVEQVFETSSMPTCEERLRTIVAALLGLPSTLVGLLPESDASSSLATTIAQITTNRLHGKGSSHTDRTNCLIALVPDGIFRNLHFSGSLNRFDFANVRFENCIFYQVAWANCKFSSSSSFVSCRFVGGSITACSDFGLATFSQNCVIDVDAKAVIDSEIIRAGRKTYSRDDLRSDRSCLVQKFIFKDGLGVRTVEERGLERGSIANSIHRDTIIDAFKRSIVESHVLTRSGMGYHVRDESKAALSHFSTNGIYTGPLATLYEDLLGKLGIQR